MVIVKPGVGTVIPLAVEPIHRRDGQVKNDCERNAARRALAKFRRDSPHLKVIVVEDGLASNGPHIRDLIDRGCRFILEAKEGDHAWLHRRLNEAAAAGRTLEFSIDGQDARGRPARHVFRGLNGVPINESNPDLSVNVLEYWEHGVGGTLHFCWVTDIPITRENAFTLMRGGRARWKVENETFNTLKNQGYHFEHNFGLGRKNLRMVFVGLMFLAFLVDQVQQLCCPLFDAALRQFRCRQAFWENLRSLFRLVASPSMASPHRALLHKGPLWSLHPTAHDSS